MADELSLMPVVLTALRRQVLSQDATTEAMVLPLRALQRLGLNSADLRVHIERMRAANDATGNNETVENNCLLALDIIAGTLPHELLRWDQAEIAKIYLPKAVQIEFLYRGLEAALQPSDMLPTRPTREISPAARENIVERIRAGLANYDIEPKRADLYRVPKAGMTTRPAAVLAPDDRVIFEALALEISAELKRNLPSAVIWPRSADIFVPHSTFSAFPASWPDAYIVVADIESFYECIDHTLLTGFISSELGMSTNYLKALESFLDVIMSSRVGLPQGPNASEIFASAYLLPIDSMLESQAWTFARYVDDFRIGADSIVDGRRKIESLEGLLREAGLRLNVSKTKIMRRDTYIANLDRPSQQVGRFREEILNLAKERLRNSEDEQEVVEALESVGVDEDTMFELFYHQTITLDDVLEDFGELFLPTLVDSYEQYFNRVARRLRKDNLPEDMLSAERDLRECLTILAGASRYVNIQLFDAMLKWFPRLAQQASIYLRSIADSHSPSVRKLIAQWLDPPADTDWVTAWLCNVVEFHPDLISKRLQEIFIKLVSDNTVGLLTRTGAARALAAAGKLDEASLRELLNSSTAAIQAELRLALLDAERETSVRREIE